MICRSLLTLSALIAFALPLHAQVQQGTAAASEYKDPGTATVLSVVIIGGGQFYSGDTHKGAVLLGIGYGSLLVGEGIAVTSCSSVNGSCGVGAAAFLAGLGTCLGTWIYGIATASDAAQQHNAGLPKPHASIEPAILPDRATGKERVGLGLKLRF